MNTQDQPVPASELILYRSDDAKTRIQVRLEGESVWLTQAQIADLYQVSVKTVSEHLQNIFEEEEIEPERTIRKFRIVQIEGTRQVRRPVDHYHLAAIIAVGYRVRSPRGTQFRQWATERLSDYLVKGFAIDEERLKRDPDDDYFEDLLGKIRDIRSSEKVFWRQVLKIYATSVDYDASAEASKRFFATVQNKMHWAAHGHTAAELIMQRADGGKPEAGMTNWVGATPRGSDATVAKSYLQADELEALNRIVTAYLEFAELQAMNRRPMTMADWIAKLDDFLHLGDREVLTHPAASATTRRWSSPRPSSRAIDSRNWPRPQRSSGTSMRRQKASRSWSASGMEQDVAGRLGRPRASDDAASTIPANRSWHRLAAALGTTERFWLGLQADYALEEAHRALGDLPSRIKRLAA